MTKNDPQITFLIEARELLLELEEGLLALENDPEELSNVNCLFRAIHTIKGSAGLFGFDEVSNFAHIVENILDEIRQDNLVVDEELIADLLISKDITLSLVEHCVAGDATINEATLEARRIYAGRLQKRIDLLCDSAATHEKTSEVKVEDENPASALNVEFDDRKIHSPYWHISLRFNEDVLRQGMDPLSFLRYLTKIGQIIHIKTLYQTLPDINEMNPESCYLGFELSINSNVTQQQIVDVFEFIKNEFSHLHVCYSGNYLRYGID